MEAPPSVVLLFRGPEQPTEHGLALGSAVISSAAASAIISVAVAALAAVFGSRCAELYGQGPALQESRYALNLLNGSMNNSALIGVYSASRVIFLPVRTALPQRPFWQEKQERFCAFHGNCRCLWKRAYSPKHRGLQPFLQVLYSVESFAASALLLCRNHRRSQAQKQFPRRLQRF